MKPNKVLTSACKYCRHYQPEGRRGGTCKQLSAHVQAGWKACALAMPAFAPTWETLEDAWSLPVATPILANNHTINPNLDNRTTVPAEETSVSSLQEVTPQAVLI
jgi:hypothetical protein